MKLGIFAAVAASVFSCGVSHASGLGESVSPIRWDRMDTSPLGGEFAGQVRDILRRSHKYAMNRWWNDVKGFAAQSGEYLDFGGRVEKFIRPVSHEAFAMAVALRLGIYDPGFTGVPADTARERTIRLIRSLAYRHRSNSGDGGWGGQWQSALWAAQAATAAWMMWDGLSAADRDMVCRMTEYEADRFIDYKIPYYKDRDGNVKYRGDSKAEENAWNSNIVTVAALMMPDHDNAAEWTAASARLQVSAYAMPQDLDSRRKVNGLRLRDFLQGSNVESDGTVINHGLIHADYMCAIMHNTLNVWICALAGRPGLEASVRNGDKVYHALTDLPFAGGTFYVRDSAGGASARMYYPQGNDWGTGRQDGYWLMDIMAATFGWDRTSTVKAMDWAWARNGRMAEMQARYDDGRIYGDAGENRFDTREEWFAAQLTFGYICLWQARNGMMRISNRNVVGG